MKPKISIVVPIFKVEKFIFKCVKSIQNQTYQNLEIILVDDGSPDNCPQICDQLASEDSRIKVIHKDNGGLSSARNAGIDIARGEFIMFVDSDDSIHPQMCEVLINSICSLGVDIACCTFKKVKENRVVKDKIINLNKLDLKVYENNGVMDLLFNKKIPLIMTAWGKLYKKEIFKNIRYPKGVIHEDEAIIHHILSECKKISFANVPLYYYTQRNSSIITSKFNRKRLVVLKHLNERQLFISEKYPELKDNAIRHYLKILILYYYYSKWANLDYEILEKIKKEIDKFVLQGYSSRLTKLFKKYPIVLGLILKLREKLGKY